MWRVGVTEFRTEKPVVGDCQDALYLVWKGASDHSVFSRERGDVGGLRP